jgi:hypothetical protein
MRCSLGCGIYFVTTVLAIQKSTSGCISPPSGLGPVGSCTKAKSPAKIGYKTGLSGDAAAKCHPSWGPEASCTQAGSQPERMERDRQELGFWSWSLLIVFAQFTSVIPSAAAPNLWSAMYICYRPFYRTGQEHLKGNAGLWKAFHFPGSQYLSSKSTDLKAFRRSKPISKTV